MKTIAILTTGGTIAMTRQESAGGAVPTLHPADFITHLGDHLPPLRVEEACSLPSAHLTLDGLQQIRAQVIDLLQQPEIAGVVITHGTDTMEETAFYLDITTDRPEPIVLTGAMRTATEIGYEGYANITHAVRVAGAESARNRGALIVSNNEIHAARWVTKTHTLALDTFKSPYYGPIGRVNEPHVSIVTPAGRRPTLASGELEPNVTALKTGVDASPLLLKYLIERETRGIIIEGVGGGRVPPAWLEPIERAVSGGSIVIISTRCHAGQIVDQYGYAAAHRDLKAAGCLFANGLNTAKCRIKLMAILGQAGDPETIRALWEQI